MLVDYPWPEKFPFTARDFRRLDEGADASFYSAPRMVTHIDAGAIAALSAFYADALPASGGDEDVAILDLCSSWLSHLPEGYAAHRIVGLGMNAHELGENAQLTEFVVRDLNVDPTLPFQAASFDAVVNAVSVDYLTDPLAVFREICRVLKPGGQGDHVLLQPVLCDQSHPGMAHHTRSRSHPHRRLLLPLRRRL